MVSNYDGYMKSGNILLKCIAGFKEISVLSKYTDICMAELEQGSDSNWVNVTTGSRFALVDLQTPLDKTTNSRKFTFYC